MSKRNQYPKGTEVRFSFRRSAYKQTVMHGTVIRAWQNRLEDATHPGWWYSIKTASGDVYKIHHPDVIGEEA